jgi:hypothetical protein
MVEWLALIAQSGWGELFVRRCEVHFVRGYTVFEAGVTGGRSR